MTLSNKYKLWTEKLMKTLRCSKGQEGAVLLTRFCQLRLPEGLLNGYTHARILHRISEDFAKDRKNLRWVSKLNDDCERWEKAFESTLRVSEVSMDDVIKSLIEGKIDIDLAVGLTNG